MIARKNAAIAMLLFISMLSINSVSCFSPSRMYERKVSQSLKRSSSLVSRASAYDKEEGYVVEDKSSAEEIETTADKKEKVSQVMVVAVGAFFSYSVIVVSMNTASFVTGSMSEAFDIGSIANFMGSVLGTVAGATWSGMKVAAPVVGKGVMSAGQAAAPYVQEASQKVTEVATPYVQEAAQKVSEAASPVVEQAAQAMNEAASPYVSAVDATIYSATSAVTSTIKDATDSVVTAVDSTVKATTDSVVTAVDSSIKEAAGSVSSTLQGVAGGAIGSIKQNSPF